MAQDPTSSIYKETKTLMVDVNTCNTENFGITTPPIVTLYAKAYCLTANGYPSVDGFTHRTYIVDVEESDSCKQR